MPGRGSPGCLPDLDATLAPSRVSCLGVRTLPVLVRIVTSWCDAQRKRTARLERPGRSEIGTGVAASFPIPVLPSVAAAGSARRHPSRGNLQLMTALGHRLSSGGAAMWVRACRAVAPLPARAQRYEDVPSGGDGRDRAGSRTNARTRCPGLPRRRSLQVPPRPRSSVTDAEPSAASGRLLRATWGPDGRSLRGVPAREVAFLGASVTIVGENADRDRQPRGGVRLD